MYQPKPFMQQDFTQAKQLINESPLATLVCSTANGVEINHLPVIYDSKEHCIYSHFANSNPLCDFEGKAVTLVFNGANGYISPSWTKQAKGNDQMVPTWNYSVLHVEGQLDFIQQGKAETLKKINDYFESQEANPWSLDDLHPKQLAGMLKAITLIKVDVRNWRMKQKLGQNKNVSTRLVQSEVLHSRNPALSSAMQRMTN